MGKAERGDVGTADHDGPAGTGTITQAAQRPAQSGVGAIKVRLAAVGTADHGASGRGTE